MSNYHIIYYSLFLPKTLTEEILGERSHYYQQIIRIKRYTHCNIHGDTTKSIVLHDGYFTAIEITYDKKLGDHFSCMRMLNKLFNQICLGDSEAFKCIPYRFILRDVKGLYHTISFEREIVHSLSQLPVFFQPIVVDELLNIGKHEIPPECHTPDLIHKVKSVTKYQENSDVDSLPMKSSEKLVTHEQVGDEGSVSTGAYDERLSSKCSCREYDSSEHGHDRNHTNERNGEQHPTAMDPSGIPEEEKSTSKIFVNTSSLKNIIGRIISNIKKVSSTTQDSTTEKLENHPETSVTADSKPGGDLLTSNSNNNIRRRRSMKKRITGEIRSEEHSKINITVAVSTSTDHQNSKLATRKDLDALFNHFPRFFERCKAAMPLLPTRKLLNEMIMILDKESHFDEWQKSNANHSDFDTKIDIDKAQLESTSSQSVAAVERKLFRILYHELLDMYSLSILKRNYHKIAVDTSLDEISDICSRTISESAPREIKPERSSIRWESSTNIKDYSPPESLNYHEGLLEHESLAAVQAAAKREKSIVRSDFWKKCNTFEIDEQHHWYSFANQRPILKEIFEDLLKEIVSGIVKPWIKSY